MWQPNDVNTDFPEDIANENQKQVAQNFNKDFIKKLKCENIHSKANIENEFYKCGICKMVVMEPKECDICHTPYCGDCLKNGTQFNLQMEKCAKNCSYSKIVPIHRFVKQLIE